MPSRFILVLAALLPVAAWSGSDLAVVQDSTGPDPVAGRARLTASRASGQPVSATAPASTESAPTGDVSGPTTPGRFDLALGKRVFNHACLTCHGNSALDAPRVGDMHVWQPRLTQGLDVLIQHALHGHGHMPAKGGYSSLTDYEVGSAVAYVYQLGTEILAKQDNPVSRPGCDPVSNLDQCTPQELMRLLVLQMLWLLGGPGHNTTASRRKSDTVAVPERPP